MFTCGATSFLFDATRIFYNKMIMLCIQDTILKNHPLDELPFLPFQG
jgi:hypothetical protein